MNMAYVHDHLCHILAGAKKQQVYPVKATPAPLDLPWTYPEVSEIDQKTTHPEMWHLH